MACNREAVYSGVMSLLSVFTGRLKQKYNVSRYLLLLPVHLGAHRHDSVVTEPIGRVFKLCPINSKAT